MALRRGTPLRDSLNGTNAADRIFGLGSNDTLIGLGGNDILDGGTGVDLMRGGLGSDTYVVDNAADRVIELPGQGNDIIKSRVSLTIAAHVEKVQLIGSASINATGSNGNDVLTGNAGANILSALGGNDVLSGGGGSDQLFGGSGNDTLIPGAGNGVADFIDGGPDYDTVDYRDASGGLTVSLVNGTVGGAAVGDTFAGVENVVGSRFADTLQPSTTQFAYAAGGAGYDIIFASTANYDRIRGDAGIDTLIGDNTSDDDFWLQYDQGMDYVRDYRSGGEDHVFISRSEFNLSTPAGNFINATDFAAGIPAGVPAFGINGRLVYDFLTNILWADRDGSGTQFETVAIAVFGVGSAEPTAADIFVF